MTDARLRKARYRRSAKGRAAKARYKRSAKGKVAEKAKAVAARYRRSAKGKAAQARADARYSRAKLAEASRPAPTADK